MVLGRVNLCLLQSLLKIVFLKERVGQKMMRYLRILVGVVHLSLKKIKISVIILKENLKKIPDWMTHVFLRPGLIEYSNNKGSISTTWAGDGKKPNVSGPFSLEPMKVVNLALPKSVCIAIPAYDGSVPVEMAIQLSQAVSKLRGLGVEVVLQSERNNGLVDVVRNTLVDRFLKKTDCEKLLFIDSDIVFKADDLIRLLAFSTKYSVVGSTYPIKKDEPIGFFVQLMEMPPKLNEYGLISVRGFGAGFVAIDRSVFLLMEPRTEKYYLDGEFTRYYQTGVVDGKYRGEDIWFFNRYIDEFGGTVILDPWIDLEHVGKKYYGYKFQDWLCAQRQ